MFYEFACATLFLDSLPFLRKNPLRHHIRIRVVTAMMHSQFLVSLALTTKIPVVIIQALIHQYKPISSVTMSFGTINPHLVQQLTILPYMN